MYDEQMQDALKTLRRRSSLPRLSVMMTGPMVLGAAIAGWACRSWVAGAYVPLAEACRTFLESAAGL